jgi:hypothetical protein
MITLAVAYPNQDITTAVQRLVLIGTVSNSANQITVTITMAGKTYTPAVKYGIFSQPLSFTKAGQYVITVTATDPSGNTTSVTRNVIYRPRGTTGGGTTGGGTTGGGTTGGGTTGGGTTGGGTTTTHPFGWTNPVSSHPDYVDKNGVSACLSCHSIDPASKGQPMSCYNCHGKQWTTPSGGTTGGGTTGGGTSGGGTTGGGTTTTKTWSLYNQYCSGCHGTSKQGKSASAIQNAINSNTGGMGSLKSLTAAQISAIAAGQ